ncbi:hypothetical protein GCM10010435_61490 [Winogradskya consettensis]|uniref:Uncharacterized protein n=1 Tax=Winogradskya consettensis TaxID=113560 RepID=A0A919SSC4_9ACTN|nr:hypothetical protein Aco04nite_49070 [Actinoplanes consettensis]
MSVASVTHRGQALAQRPRDVLTLSARGADNCWLIPQPSAFIPAEPTLIAEVKVDTALDGPFGRFRHRAAWSASVLISYRQMSPRAAPRRGAMERTRSARWPREDTDDGSPSARPGGGCGVGKGGEVVRPAVTGELGPPVILSLLPA